MSAYLKTVSTSSGFLQDCPVEFGRGLTCVIGARGTCKSTLIESIRFAFELEEIRVATLVGKEDGGEPRSPVFGIIENTLRAGSVRCELEIADSSSQQKVTLEREVGGEPRIFVDGVREHTNRDLLRDIEIFSQGDLQRVAEDDNDKLRLALIDRPHRNQVAELNAERRNTAEKLRGLGPHLRAIRGQLSTLNHKVTQLDPARSQLDRLTKEAPAASPELEAEREGHERRQRVLQAVRSVEVEWEGLVNHLEYVRAPARQIAESIASVTADTASTLGDKTALLMDLAAAVGEVMTAAQKIESVRLAPLIDSLDRRFEDASERYYQLRQQEQAVNESLKQQHVLKRQVEHLEQLKTQADTARVEELRLLKVRRNLRGELQRIDDRLYELRIAEIDSINSEHGDTVQLTLGSSWNSRRTLSACANYYLVRGSGRKKTWHAQSRTALNLEH